MEYFIRAFSFTGGGGGGDVAPPRPMWDQIANPSSMHPITLRFADPGFEDAARGEIFRSSYWIVMAA